MQEPTHKEVTEHVHKQVNLSLSLSLSLVLYLSLYLSLDPTGEANSTKGSLREAEAVP